MGGRNPLPEDFEYNSGTNPWFLTIDEMREMLDGIAMVLLMKDGQMGMLTWE
jgi:hypothetical protein